jgi:hypothetical protein
MCYSGLGQSFPGRHVQIESPRTSRGQEARPDGLHSDPGLDVSLHSCLFSRVGQASSSMTCRVRVQPHYHYLVLIFISFYIIFVSKIEVNIHLSMEFSLQLLICCSCSRFTGCISTVNEKQSSTCDQTSRLHISFAVAILSNRLCCYYNHFETSDTKNSCRCRTAFQAPLARCKSHVQA